MTAVVDSRYLKSSPKTANQSAEPHNLHVLNDHGSSSLSTNMTQTLMTTATPTLANGIHQPMPVTKYSTLTSHPSVLAYLSRISSRRRRR